MAVLLKLRRFTIDECHRMGAAGPASGGYRRVRVLARGESLTVESFPDVRIAVTDLLG